MDTKQLIEEWSRKDPFLLDLEGFQQFCDIRLAGSLYPLHEEDIFRSVEPIREEWRECARELTPNIGTCQPQESADDYWNRNSASADAVKAVIALYTKKPEDKWPEYLARHHLKWVETEFGFALTEEDFEKAWELWEHPYWFSNDGYYVKGWLAVADGLGIGAKAREILEKTPFPHADHPKSRDTICSKLSVCPIYQYREYLNTVQIDVPDLVWRHTLFQSNLDYRLHVDRKATKQEALQIINRSETDFKIKWLILRMVKDYQTLPKCQACGELSYSSWKIGCDNFERDLERLKGLELCYTCCRKVDKAYETKMMPLKFGSMPETVEIELRKKLIEGDEMFADITVDERDEV